LPHPSPPSYAPPCTSFPHSWSPSLERFIKLNFECAYKGNLGSTGFGGVFRDVEGKIICLFIVFIGINTNNVAKIWGLSKE
jgi:hypothetical protein